MPRNCFDLKFWLITGSRRFALFYDVSRLVRDLRTSGCVTPATTCVAAGNGRPADRADIGVVGVSQSDAP